MEDKQLKQLKDLLDETLQSHLDSIQKSREMTDKKIKETVKETVKEAVNGKVDALHKKIDDFTKRALPAVEFFENVGWTKKFILTCLLFIGALGGAVAAIKTIINSIHSGN